MDDALLVANLVYIGTLILGGVLFAFLAAAFGITLLIAGAGQGIASIIGLLLRPLRRTAGQTAAERTTADAADADHIRTAVIAKADAILASQRAAAVASSEAASSARDPKRDATGATQAEDEDVAVPAAAPAASTTAVEATVTLVRPAASRPIHTGTQPVLAVGRAS
ncbi:hypothetical protein [Sinomonas sp. B1-1]|uniref:hypothetical protein n=1 Tax=Sinomonas sp. B1-1 TaxID=3141454 RepID=UPI003D2C945B